MSCAPLFILIIGVPALLAALAGTAIVAGIYAAVTKKRPRLRWLTPLFLALFLGLPTLYIAGNVARDEIRSRRQERSVAMGFGFDIYLPERPPAGFRLERARAVGGPAGRWADFTYESEGESMYLVTHPVTGAEMKDQRCNFHPLRGVSAGYYSGPCEVVQVNGSVFTLAIATDATRQAGMRKAFAITGNTIVAIYHSDLSRAELIRMVGSLKQQEPSKIQFESALPLSGQGP